MIREHFPNTCQSSAKAHDMMTMVNSHKQKVKQTHLWKLIFYLTGILSKQYLFSMKLKMGKWWAFMYFDVDKNRNSYHLGFSCLKNMMSEPTRCYIDCGINQWRLPFVCCVNSKTSPGSMLEPFKRDCVKYFKIAPIWNFTLGVLQLNTFRP